MKSSSFGQLWRWLTQSVTKHRLEKRMLKRLQLDLQHAAGMIIDIVKDHY